MRGAVRGQRLWAKTVCQSRSCGAGSGCPGASGNSTDMVCPASMVPTGDDWPRYTTAAACSGKAPGFSTRTCKPSRCLSECTFRGAGTMPSSDNARSVQGPSSIRRRRSTRRGDPELRRPDRTGKVCRNIVFRGCCSGRFSALRGRKNTPMSRSTGYSRCPQHLGVVNQNARAGWCGGAAKVET